MSFRQSKCARALEALVCPKQSIFSWKVLAFVLLMSGATSLGSCTEFEESYYEQADGNGLGPGCKVVGVDIVCE